MNKKLLLSAASVLAIAGFATIPLAAQAGATPHWYSEGKLIVGETVRVNTAGKW